MLTIAEIDAKLAVLPPHLRVYGEAYRNQAYPRPPSPPPVHTRSPADQKLYDDCRWDLALFGRIFFPRWCSLAFNQVHLDYYAQYPQRSRERGFLDVVAASRGASKTTGCALLGILHDCAYAREDPKPEDFILYVTNVYDNAEEKVTQIRDALEFNRDFVRVYGPQVGEPWNKGDLTTLNGVRVKAAARNSQVRGITEDGARPSKIVLDDVEHPEQVMTQLQREKTDHWMATDIMNLGHPQTNIELSGTVLHPESLLSKTLKNPGWRARFYQAVIQFADASSVPLWQEWRSIFTELSNGQRQEDARAFYEAHKEEMTRGSKVLWPERRDYYALMVLRVILGEAGWWQEQQNDPLGDQRFLFNLDAAAFCEVVPAGIIRAGGTLVRWIDIVEIAGYVDPTPPKKDVTGSDYCCAVIVARDKWEYCYALDTFLAQVATPSIQITAIVEMLWRWQVQKFGIESNSFAGLMVADFHEAIAAMAAAQGQRWDVNLIPIQNMRSKVLRISSLEPMLLNGWLQLAKTLPHEALEQLRNFLPIPDASHDDFPDALEGCLRVVKGLYEKRDIH